MLCNPIHGKKRVLGLTLRWTIRKITFRDFEEIDSGFRRSVSRRICKASYLTRLVCRKQIIADIEKQCNNCLPFENKGSKTGSSEPVNAIQNSLAVWVATGLEPDRQRSTLAPREFYAILLHTDWQLAMSLYFKAQAAGAKATKPPYPDSLTPVGAKQSEEQQNARILESLTSFTRH